MPEALGQALAQALALDGLWLLILAAALAGLVRGFSGFGTALIFIPLASMVIPPIWVLIVLVVMDMFGPLPNMPRALRDGAMSEVATLLLGMVICLPIGLAVLYRIDPLVFRYAVSGLSVAMVIFLISGWRYRRALSRPVMLATGGASGFLGGVAGLPGPPVILLYMAGPNGAAKIRANTMVYLFAFDAILLIVLGLQGQLSAVPVVLGLAMALPNVLGNLAGAGLFNPDRQTLYRAAGYAITLAAAISGLPIWD